MNKKRFFVTTGSLALFLSLSVGLTAGSRG